MLSKLWRASQGSNLEPSDLESDALPIGATDPCCLLRNFAFLMDRVRTAFGAELLDRKLVGLRLFVFGRGVVARLAGVA